MDIGLIETLSEIYYRLNFLDNAGYFGRIPGGQIAQVSFPGDEAPQIVYAYICDVPIISTTSPQTTTAATTTTKAPTTTLATTSTPVVTTTTQAPTLSPLITIDGECEDVAFDLHSWENMGVGYFNLKFSEEG